MEKYATAFVSKKNRHKHITKATNIHHVDYLKKKFFLKQKML